jgi:hypothetical protein
MSSQPCVVPCDSVHSTTSTLATPPASRVCPEGKGFFSGVYHHKHHLFASTNRYTARLWSLAQADVRQHRSTVP